MPGLALEAEQDLGSILSDDGWPVTVTDPAGATAALNALNADIAQAIDPDTGQLVQGGIASASLRISDLVTATLGLPVAEQDGTKKPWRVTFDDVNGNTREYKIIRVDPDHTFGLVVCILGEYDAP